MLGSRERERISGADDFAHQTGLPLAAGIPQEVRFSGMLLPP